MAATSSSTNYDPMYCLNEHLEYFNQNVVASTNNFLDADFDDIFGADFMTNNCDALHFIEPLPTSIKAIEPTPITAPSSPKSVMTAEISREASVVSPTTVATPTFTEEATQPKFEKPRPKSRKRTISEASTESPEDPKDQEDIRRERNRQHAKRSRQRKREFLSTLEHSVKALKAENERLIQILGNDAAATRVKKEDDIQAASTERFIAGLKQPQNRVLSDSALASLRELFH